MSEQERPWPCPCGGSPCGLEGLDQERAMTTMHYAFAELHYNVHQLRLAVPWLLQPALLFIGFLLTWRRGTL